MIWQGVDGTKPEWRMMDQFWSRVVQPALGKQENCVFNKEHDYLVVCIWQLTKQIPMSEI